MAGRWTWLVVAVGLLVSGSAEGLAQEGYVERLIDELEVGNIGDLTFAVGFSMDMLGEAQRAAGEIEADIAEIRKRVDAGEATAKDWLDLTGLYAGVGEREQSLAARKTALMLYEQELADKPDDPGILVPFGRLLIDSGELERAEQLAARAAEIDPENLDAYEALIDSLTRQAVPVIQWVQRMSEQLPEGVDIEGITLEHLADPNGEASARLAATLRKSAPLVHEAFLELQKPPSEEERARRQAALDEARAVLEQARPVCLKRLKEKPTSVVFRQYARIESLIATATVWSQYERLGSPEEAADPSGFMEVVHPLLEVLSMEEVRRAGQRLCEACPDDLGIRAAVGCLQAMTTVADVLVSLVEEETAPEHLSYEAYRAIENLTAALELPLDRREPVRGALVVMYFMTDDRAAVLRTVDAAAERGEWDPNAGSAALFAALGLTLEGLAEVVEQEEDPLDSRNRRQLQAAARRLAEWLEKTDPHDAKAFANLAWIRARLDNWEGVAEALERARRIDPGHAAIARGLGVAYLKLGRHEEAAKVLKKALKLDFKGDDEAEADCHYTYGVALLALGKAEEAEKELEWEAEDE
jgi:tetratricopeptide (TPR) repeat protein